MRTGHDVTSPVAGPVRVGPFGLGRVILQIAVVLEGFQAVKHQRRVALGAFSTPDVLPFGYWPRVWAERGRGLRAGVLMALAGNENAPEPGRIERA